MIGLSRLGRSTRIVLFVVTVTFVLGIALHFGRLVLALDRDASIDAVRVRNSMVVELGEPGDVAWSPNVIPEEFNWEERPAPIDFVDVVKDVLRDAPADMTDFETALRLARHLRANAREGQPIQDNAWLTYERITTGQGGYCSDFTQTINALSLTAGLDVREWGFTWETLANGHAFNEIWEPSLNKWVFLDSHHGFYAVDGDSGIPLSALEFRSHLMDGDDADTVRLLPIDGGTFDEARVDIERSFYSRGMPRMFLLLGNNVFSYDAHPLIQLTEALPRSVEMLTAILLGQHPRFLFIPPKDRPDLGKEVEDLVWIRNLNLLLVFAGIVSAVGATFLLISLLSRR
jgi:hypothetical protein